MKKLFIAIFIAWLATIAGVIYVAIHFIMKFW